MKSLIIGFIIIIIVLIAIIRDKNKEIEKYHKDWKFCKSLLDDTRALLTEEQKEKLIEIHTKKK